MSTISKINPKYLDEQNSDVSVVDTLDGLQLFHYKECSPDSPEDLKQMRGVVVRQGEVICRDFPYTVEYTCDTVPENLITDEFCKSAKFVNAYEGTLLRAFYTNNQWYLSTHRRLDSFKSRWATRETFGTLFVESLTLMRSDFSEFSEKLGPETDVLAAFFNTLDSQYQYTFLLQNSSENRIVCTNVQKPLIFHVGTFKGEEFVEGVDTCLPTLLSEMTFPNARSVFNYVEQVDTRKMSGIVAMYGNMFVKILNREYVELFSVRGNEASIKFRYLQLRSNHSDKHLLHIFRTMYEDYRDLFELYENTIYEIAHNIHSAYVARFIKKEKDVKVAAEEYKVMRQCHSWHIENRDRNKIHIHKVIHLLNQQNPVMLNRMIKRYLHSKREQVVEQAVQANHC